MGKRLIVFCCIALSIPGLLFAQEAGVFPLWPGAAVPEPQQRSLNTIDSIPTREERCPACGRTVHVPLPDTLMRKANNDGEPPRWHMHAARRDADMAPIPGKNKLSWQADIVVCPDCGLSLPADMFGQPLPENLASWLMETLRPNLREVQKTLLGKRAATMSEAQVIDFFNRQEEIPDIVRTEHYRVYAGAAALSLLEQARASWLAAWALRRASAGGSKNPFLLPHQAAVEEMLAGKKITGQAARIDGLHKIANPPRQAKNKPSYADQLGAQLLLANELFHLGRYDEGIAIVDTIRKLSQDRFLKPEQDPLWVHTTRRATRAYRLNELETYRTDTENELSVVLGLVATEREILGDAATLLRKAILAGEATDAEHALFYAYLVGEFLRRHGEFPLAAEWLRNLRNLAPPGTPVAEAAQRQLVLVQEQAGEVNLLAALGQDGELFEQLREICASLAF